MAAFVGMMVFAVLVTHVISDYMSIAAKKNLRSKPADLLADRPAVLPEAYADITNAKWVVNGSMVVHSFVPHGYCVAVNRVEEQGPHQKKTQGFVNRMGDAIGTFVAEAILYILFDAE